MDGDADAMLHGIWLVVMAVSLTIIGAAALGLIIRVVLWAAGLGC